MTFLLTALGLCYLFLVLFFIFRSRSVPQLATAGQRELTMALVVVAYNEERKLPSFMNSLLNQDMTGCILTLHLVDDCSSDGTLELMREQIKRAHFETELHQSETGLGKVSQLRRLLPQLEDDVILLTDADCLLPYGWIQKQRQWFLSNKGVLGGAILPVIGSAFQRLDWLLISGLGTISTRVDKAQSAFGGNLSIDTESLRKVDYGNSIKGDSAEDLQLVQRALALNIPVNFRLDPQLLVSTSALPWRDYFQQKLRWSKGLLHLRPLTQFAVFALVILQLLAAVSVIQLTPQSLLISVTLGNLFLLWSFSNRLAVKLPLVPLLLYPFYWTILLLNMALGVFYLPDDWKRE
jgi:glycosyltransferase involved in cell wall biosynthesis